MQRTKILNLTFEKFFVIIILRNREKGDKRGNSNRTK